MPTAKRKAPKKPSAAEVKRRAMARKKHKPAKKTAAQKILSKKKITNKEAAKLIEKKQKAKRISIEKRKHMLKNRPGKSGFKMA